tara:strand:+ start:161 stop:1138 length:978 start_codon:yes stop_codon:yes gene_type:complete
MESSTKYVDLLDEDKAIAGQKFVCLSFISPEKILKQKEHFYFGKFLKHFDFNKSMEKFNQFLNFLSFKYNLKQDLIQEDFKEYLKEEREKLFFSTLEDDYKTFLEQREEELEKEFNAINNFQTNTRGIKVRGSFPTQEEAELRCKMIREIDPNHDVYVGPVGIWVPFHPEAYRTGRVEYLEEELNQLMSEKAKNEKTAKDNFEQRVKDAKREAIQENIEKAEKYGNKLTQAINEDGELVSASDITNITEENILNTAIDSGEVTSADIRRELFEGDNIITDFKGDDRGLSQILENKKKAEQEANTIPEETPEEVAKDIKVDAKYDY